MDKQFAISTGREWTDEEIDQLNLYLKKVDPNACVAAVKPPPANAEPAPPSPEVVRAVYEFVKDAEQLPTKVQDLLRLLNGAPFQNIIYDGALLPLKGEKLTEESVIQAAAEAYAYQCFLNRKIVRTSYFNSIDHFLMRCIHNEMTRRLPEIEKSFPLDDALEKKIFERCKTQFFTQPVQLLYTWQVVEWIKQYFKLHPKASNAEMQAELEALIIKPEISQNATKADYEKKVAEYLKDSKGPIGSWAAIGNVAGCHSQLRFPKTKDHVYAVCILCQFSIDQFEELRSMAANILKKQAAFADEQASNRDMKIQTIIKNIDDWRSSAEIEAWEPYQEQSKTFFDKDGNPLRNCKIELYAAAYAKLKENIDRHLVAEGCDPLFSKMGRPHRPHKPHQKKEKGDQ